MNKSIAKRETTRARIAEHCRTYPALAPEDLFKYLYQSAFGCEHLVTDEETVLAYLHREYETAAPAAEAPLCESLDGAYSRAGLALLGRGLAPKTLAKLFCLSAKKEENGEEELREKLALARAMAADGELPFSVEDFFAKADAWEEKGCPALHHSGAFRERYRPAYRVLANRFADFLEVFVAIDRLLARGKTVIAIEGGSASGKSTLATALTEVYAPAVIHMDDFFLRPEQRTPARMAEVGGNLDRERFAEEVLAPLGRGETVRYRRFDCSVGLLGEAVAVPQNQLTVIEGAYSMHPAFGEYYDLALFLDVAPDTQKARIERRNTPALAHRFFTEWIPKENAYFEEMGIRERAGLRIKIED